MAFEYDPATDPFTLYAFELAVEHGLRIRTPELQVHLDAARKRIEERKKGESQQLATQSRPTASSAALRPSG